MPKWWTRLFRGRKEQKKLPVLRNLWERDGNVLAVERPACKCLDAQYADSPNKRWSKLKIHDEQQDTSSEAWHQLLELVEEAAADRRKEFAPGREMDAADWTTIVTLPRTIAKLKSVKHLNLYGSSLTRIPPEIGEMESLEMFSPYTSYRLHWFPYEITRCKNLKGSTVSTRAIYGNYKYRPPFPRLPQQNPDATSSRCSVCDGLLDSDNMHQVWISLGVATDVLPLLVHACSSECIAKLPTPPDNYVQSPHEGGQAVKQPAADEFYCGEF